MKRLLCIILVAIMSISFGGCIIKKENREVTRSMRQQEMLDHIQEKYGEEFECISFSAPSLLDGGYKMYAKPKDKEGEEWEFYVGCYEDDGVLTGFYDNYMNIKMKPEYIDFLTPYVEKYFTEYQIAISAPAPFGEELNKDTTFEEYREVVEQKGINIHIYVPDTISEESAMQLTDQLADELYEQIKIGGVVTTAYPNYPNKESNYTYSYDAGDWGKEES